jgi:hypothetical protein
MQDPIIVTVNVTQEELRIFMKQSLLKHFKYLKYFLFFAVPLILLNVYTLIQAGSSWSNIVGIFIPFFVIFIAWQFLTRIGSKNTYQQKKEDFEHSVYTFSDDGLNLKSATVEAKLNWDAFKKVELDNKFLWLFISKNQAYILPIRCFEKKETLDAVYQLLKEKIK